MVQWSLSRIQTAAFASPGAVVLPVQDDGARRSYQEHEAILNAIEARDGALAEELLKQHAETPIRAIEAAVQGRLHQGRNIAIALVGNKPTTAPPAEIPSRPRLERTGATAERILDAAADLFCEIGRAHV